MLSHLAAVDGLTFHTLANSAMLRQLWRAQGYQVPTCEKTIKRMVVQYSIKLQDQFKEDILQQQKKGKRFSLCMDEWSSLRNRRYAGVTLHGEEVQLLGLIRITGTMPAEKGRDLLVAKLLEFNLHLEEDIVGISTDGATVMRKMGRLLPIQHQVCTLHGLHLAVTDVFYKRKEDVWERDNEEESEEDEEDAQADPVMLAEVDGEPNLVEFGEAMELNDRFGPLIQKVRKISKSFRRSPLKNDLLEKKCQEKGMKPKPLVSDTKTRWNSMLAMLKRFLEMKDLVGEVLSEMDTTRDFPAEEELRLLSDLVEALEIVEDGSLELSKDDCDLAKADIAFRFMLQELNSLTSPVGKSLFKAVEKRIQERRKKSLAALLSFLKDPAGYNNMADDSTFLNYPRPSELAKEARDLYTRLFLRRIPHQEEEVDEDEPVAKSRKERLSDMMKGKHKSPKGLTSTSTPEEVLESLKTEMRAFVSTDTRPPCLQKIYDALTTFPPSSISVERSFSTSNMFVSKVRGNLNDDTINNLMFLRSSLKKTTSA